MLVLEKKKKKKKRKESVVNIWLKKKRAVSGSIPFFNDLVPKEIIHPPPPHSRPPTVHVPFRRECDRSRIKKERIKRKGKERKEERELTWQCFKWVLLSVYFPKCIVSKTKTDGAIWLIELKINHNLVWKNPNNQSKTNKKMGLNWELEENMVLPPIWFLKLCQNVI